MDTKQNVLETLKKSDNPLKSSEIAKKNGLDKKDIDKAIKQLKTDDLIKSHKRCF